MVVSIFIASGRNITLALYQPSWMFREFDEKLHKNKIDEMAAVKAIIIIAIRDELLFVFMTICIFLFNFFNRFK